MTGGTDEIFYDGTCGLCHLAVRFVLGQGERGKGFRFAPLQGSTFLERIPAEEREDLPDSMVVWTKEGQVLSRSRAVLHILHRLGGGWKLLGWMGRILPRFLADALYDVIAMLRHRLFRRPESTCPLVGPEDQQRFDD